MAGKNVSDWTKLEEGKYEHVSGIVAEHYAWRIGNKIPKGGWYLFGNKDSIAPFDGPFDTLREAKAYALAHVYVSTKAKREAERDTRS